MKRKVAHLIYNPLTVVFDLIPLGGSVIQKREKSTGEYTSDRTLTPLVIAPKLHVEDPEGIISNGDYTHKLIAIRWFVGDTNHEINTKTEGYSIGSLGQLTVSKNIAPDTSVKLIFTATYVDPRRDDLMRFDREIFISCEATTDVNLSLEIDVPTRQLLSPFKTKTTRTITATLYNGTSIITGEYDWQILDGDHFRSITSDDLCYVSGQGTASLTIDKRFIDREIIRVEANHTNVKDVKVSAQTKLIRWYGQWEENLDILRGQFVHTSNTEVEVQAKVTTKQGNIADICKYFDVGIFCSINGGDDFKVSNTPTYILPANSFKSTNGSTVSFGLEVREKTALRVLTFGGKALTVNGKKIVCQVPTIKSEVE